MKWNKNDTYIRFRVQNELSSKHLCTGYFNFKTRCFRKFLEHCVHFTVAVKVYANVIRILWASLKRNAPPNYFQLHLYVGREHNKMISLIKIIIYHYIKYLRSSRTP